MNNVINISSINRIAQIIEFVRLEHFFRSSNRFMIGKGSSIVCYVI